MIDTGADSPQYLRFVFCILVTTAATFSASSLSAEAARDVTQESQRERGRILLKRNPIASEYLEIGRLGLGASGDDDAEAVDFRSQFRLKPLKAEQKLLSSRVSWSYQGQSGEPVPGGQIHLGYASREIAGQLQVTSNASSRVTSHYQSRWLSDFATSAAGTPLALLGYPRFTEDQFTARNNEIRWRFDVTEMLPVTLSYEGVLTNYADESYRNRMEYQVAAGAVSSLAVDEGAGSIVSAVSNNARLRRYFHTMDTTRDIQRHQISLSWQDRVRLHLYSSSWVNQRDWSPWNFVDRGLDITYKLDDPYVPELSLGNNVDITDIGTSEFANYRPSLLETTDRDRGLRLDIDHELAATGTPVWISSGILYRSKRRNVSHSREVFLPTPNTTLSLAEVTDGAGATLIIENRYLLPAGLNVPQAESLVDTAGDTLFTFVPDASFLESLQEIFESKETVSALYIALEQQRIRWRWEAGLRYEATSTGSTGSVTGPPDILANLDGEIIPSLQINNRLVQETFPKFDAYRVTGQRRYHHLVPNVTIRFEPRDELSLRASWHRSLMRPQYFDTVSYRRVNPPTRSISEGNPALDATVIDSLALALEWQTANWGKYGLELYNKDISKFFYDAQTTETLDGILYEVSSVQNGGSGTIRGLQAEWKQRVEPAGAWPGADVSVAYTYSSSTGEIRDRTIALPERSRHLVQSSLRLTKDPWNYRMSFSWQSKALDRVGETQRSDQYRKSVLQFDHTLSRQFGKRVNTSISLINLLDYPDRSYEGNESRTTDNQYLDYSLTASITISL